MVKFEPKDYRKNVPDKELIADLKRVAGELKMNSVTIAEYQRRGTFPFFELSHRFGSWAKTLKEAGLEQRRAFGVTKKELLADLKRVTSELKKDWLSVPEYEKYGKFGSRTFSRKFGSWTVALEKAGLDVRYSRDITAEELLTNLGKAWIKLGRQPRPGEIHKPLSKYCGATYRYRFGGWTEALEQFIKYAHSGRLPALGQKVSVIPAKFEPLSKNVPDAGLVADLKRVASVLKKNSVSLREYAEHGKFHTATFRRRFGSWSAATEKVGLKPGKVVQRITDENLFRNLMGVWVKVGRQPPACAMQKPVSKYSLGPYQRRFGGWMKALEQFIKYAHSGRLSAPGGKTSIIPKKLRRFRGNRNILDAELIADIKRVASALKKNYLGLDEYDKHGKFSDNTFYRRFGSWFKATEKAGLKARGNLRRNYR
jgi:hypothetical protein